MKLRDNIFHKNMILLYQATNHSTNTNVHKKLLFLGFEPKTRFSLNEISNNGLGTYSISEEYQAI